MDASPASMSPGPTSKAFTTAETHGIVVTTLFEVPGYRIVKTYGIVYGLVVRSRNALSYIRASFKSIVGGELVELTKNLYLSRNIAVERMVGEAQALEANAVLATRYDNTTPYGIPATEMCIYGTACLIEPVAA